MPPLLSSVFTLGLDILAAETLALIILTLILIGITVWVPFSRPWTSTRTVLSLTALPLAAPPPDPLDTDLRWLKEIVDDLPFINSFASGAASFSRRSEVDHLVKSISEKIKT